MVPRLSGVVLLLALSAARSTARVVRLDTGQGRPLIHLPPADEAKPVELGDEEFIKEIAKEVRQKRPLTNPEKPRGNSSKSPHAVAGIGTASAKVLFL